MVGQRAVLRRGTVVSIGVVAVLAAVTVGFVIGYHAKSTSVDGTRDRGLPVVTARTLNNPHGPHRMDGDLPVGFTDDSAGALSAAAVASEALIDLVQNRRITTLTRWLATYTRGPLSPYSLQTIGDWNPALYRLTADARPTALAPRTSALSVTALVPIGYKMLAYSHASAHLQIWLHGTGWTQGATAPNTLIDRSADIELVWAGDWKISEYTHPTNQTWDGPSLDDPGARGFVPWPGGQFTFVTG